MTLLNVFSDARIGPYTDENFIGKGGMSKVFKVDADNVDKVNRIVNFETEKVTIGLIDRIFGLDTGKVEDTRKVIPGIFTPRENDLCILLSDSEFEHISKAEKVEYQGNEVIKFDELEIDLESKVLLHAYSEYNVLRTLKNCKNVVQISNDFEEPILALDSKRNFISIIRMNYVKGKNLAFLGQNNLLTTEDVAQIMIDICDVLEYFESKGIVHRDIKPGNIISNIENGERKNTVIDFGLAVTLDEPKYLPKDLQESFNEKIKPREGSVIGTPSYISPEAVRGELASYSSDAFSLGSTFFHLFTRRVPFHGEGSKRVIDKITDYSEETDRFNLMDRFLAYFVKGDNTKNILANGIECLLHEDPNQRKPSYARDCAKQYLRKKFSN